MSTKQRVWVSRPIFPDIVDRLRPYVEVVAETEDTSRSPEALKAWLREFDGAVIGLTERIDAATLEGNTRLKVLSNVAVGYNNLDIPALTRAGVLATNTPDVLTETVADHAWALLLAAARQLGASERWLRAGHWQGFRFDQWLGFDVHGKTLGILGMGRIGQAVARRGLGFNTRTLYHNRSRLPEAVERECRAQYVDKASLLRESDHLVLVLPYTPENHHTLGETELALMKPKAVLVNIARGGLVDDAALARALREQRLGAAGLDVYEGEPNLHPALLECDNAVLCPHIGSASEDTRRAMAALAIDNVLAALGHGPHAGRPPAMINPQAWNMARPEENPPKT